uniref:NADH-ubiquinone oxidoreductase chain 1 n=1 Tax=Rhizophydium sp. 136 TaxID=60187 RepID=Q950L6_9FUNG|nr:NADH dehydrogenase subunit 1 [Rhizophydium sp. 136]AAK84292.1 NADH dehydrogenase subunit 1 [Rhizophydium sp. 136]
MIPNLIILLGVIVMVIFSTLAERKVMGSCQKRLGPNTVGYLGTLQALADGVKLIIKETIIPSYSQNVLFILSPFYFFGISLLNWLIIPLDNGLTISEINGTGIIITVALSEMSILGILYAGYSSNSKYSLLGTLRAIAQCISYGITMSLGFICIILFVGSVDYLDILNSQSSTPLIYALLPVGIILLISFVAELGRPPFDLLESESELVAGHMSEYAGVTFAFFFLAEYSMMLFYGVLLTVLLFGFSNPVPFLFFLIWIRASLPRIRIDSLINLNWSHFLPFLTGYLIFLIPLILVTLLNY